ncbi:hypothetical protein ACEPAI_5368 [Sanghuangporus weigelae]
MRSLALFLKICLFVLAVQAKHDGQLPDDDGGSGGGGDDDDTTSSSFSSTIAASSSSPSPTATQIIASTSTVLLTSTFTSDAGAQPSGSSSASATSPASPAVPSGALQFSPPSNVTMCEPAIFTWEFDVSTSVLLAIVITNERVVSVQSGSPGQAPLVERTIATSVDARTCVVSWPQVDVPEGAYSLLAADTAHSGILSAQSPSFFVQAGSDSSCLNQTSTVSGSASQPVDTAGSTSNDTADPADSPRSSRSMSIGAIVGTVASILVGVGGLLFVFSLPRLRRHILRSKAPQRPGGPYILF